MLENASGFETPLRGLQILEIVQSTGANWLLKKTKAEGQIYALRCSRWPAWDRTVTSAHSPSWLIELVENGMPWEAAETAVLWLVLGTERARIEISWALSWSWQKQRWSVGRLSLSCAERLQRWSEGG